MSALKIKNLHKKFGEKPIIEDISIETTDGELLVILGPSGCGKSTILRLICGLETPDSGEIYIGERRVDSLPPQKRNVALVFQNYALYPHMTVAKNLAFPLKIAGTPKAEIDRRVKETAELLGLGDRLNSRPAELSGGQRQRVALGRAIIRQPDLYLLDEPLSNLDADLRSRMRRELVELQKSLGTTTVYVTHDQTEALTMADRLAVIFSGKIRQVGAPEEIYKRPVDTEVASFLGSPKINLIAGVIDNGVIKPFGFPASSIDNHYKEPTVTIGVRPEDILFSENAPFEAIVRSTEYLGDRLVVVLEFAGIELTATASSGQFGVGDHLRFSINPTPLLFFHPATGRRTGSKN